MIGLTGLIVWLAFGERMPGWWAGEQELAVQVAPVRTYDFEEKIHVTGVLMPVNEMQAVSPLAGRVADLRVKKGDSVSAGALIAVIQADEIAHRQAELEAAVQSAREDLRSKEDQLAAAQQSAAHRGELFKQDLIARRELENAVAALQTLGAETELARVHLSQREAMLAQAVKIQSLSQITAPSAGVVSRRWVEPGAMVAAASPIVTIASGNLVKFVGRASGAQAGMLREGMSAVISIGEGIEGIVSRVISGRSPDQRGVELEVQLKTSAAKVRLGMAATALISVTAAGPTLRVPRSAVFKSAGIDYVYKISAGRAVRQRVNLGAEAGSEVVIEQGVDAGDLVIVDRVHALKPWSRVRAAAQLPAS